MSKADEYRKQAEDAGQRARITRSLKGAVLEHRRQRALIDLATNEDWLDGVTYVHDEPRDGSRYRTSDQRARS